MIVASGTLRGGSVTPLVSGYVADLFGNYDLACRFGVSLGIVAGIVQVVFGGPSGTWSCTRPAAAAG